MKANTAILFTLALLFTVMVRLSPIIYTGVFFSNDVWPLIRLAEHIIENPSVGIYSLTGEYGYHSAYPFSTLECIVYTLVTGMSLDCFFKYAGTVVLSITMFLSVYVLAMRFSHSYRPRLLASLAISLIPSFTIYTSAYLKEFYGYALTPLALCIAMRGSKLRIPLLLPLSILSLALVMSHPLASAMSIAILFSYLYVNYVYFLKGRELLRVNSGCLLAVLLSATAFILYTSTIAKLPIVVSVNDVLVFTVYSLVVYLAYLFVSELGSGFLIALVSLPALTSFFYTATAPVSVIPLALYIAPLAFSTAYKTWVRALDGVKEAVLLPIATLFLYILTYMVEALGFIHRVVNYLVYALIPIGINVGEKCSKVGLAVFTLLAVSTATCSMLVAINQDPYTFYWRYGEYDFILKYFTKTLAVNVTMYGDPKYSYMTPEIKSISLTMVREICGLREFIALSRENYVYGIPFTPVDFYKLPNDLLKCRSIVFNEGYLHVLA
ncbi:MAG: hypothetical protein QW521_05440 [Desulfurococcaceae archaeon]